MGIELPPAMLERYVQKQDKVQGILQQIDYSVNNNQFAAAVAVLCDPKSRRQFLSVPSGMGKSRILAAVLVLKHEYDRTNKFTIVFTTDLLKSVDERVYTHLKNLLGLDLDLVVYDSRLLLESQVRKDDFVVIDEADQILLDYQESLPNHSRVLALSATPFAEQKVFEKEFLESSKFKCIDSKISGTINWKTATERASLKDFLRKSDGYAKLIFDADSCLPPS